MTLGEAAACILRRWADRLDHAGAPKRTHVSFTFEDRAGMMFRDDGRGCPLWYYGDAGYQRAHDEAGPLVPSVGGIATSWVPLTWHRMPV